VSNTNRNSKIKILMLVSKLDLTGISAVVMNYCSHMDLSKFEIEIAAGEPIADIHKTTCESLGIKLHQLPNRWNGSKKYYKEINRILREKKFDILHVHGNSATMAVELFLGWKHGVKIRIAHSHNTTCTHMRAHKMLLPLFNRLYTHAFACGKKAGEWLFGNKKFYVIPNGFNTQKFKFNAEARNKIRSQLGVEKAFIIGHVGRINEQKNQPFLVKVFEEFAAKRDDAVLLYVGIGPDSEKLNEIINSSPYKDRIIMYGETNTPEELYSAMDVFVLPSKYEGLPVVLLEAECSGLFCVISDKVTDEMSIDNHISSLSLEAPLQSWCDKIEAIPVIDRLQFYSDNKTDIEKYDIAECAKRLEELYINFMSK